MQEVVLLVFAHALIITAVVTGSLVGAILSFKFHFMLDGHCVIEDWESTFIDKRRSKQETRKKNFFGNTSFKHLYRMVSMSE